MSNNNTLRMDATMPKANAKRMERNQSKLDRTNPPPGRANIQPLPKPAVKEMFDTVANMGAYQDQKRDIYQKHCDDMGEMFEDARAARRAVQSDFEARNKMVLDRLADIRARCEAKARAILEKVKEYSDEFELQATARKNAAKSRVREVKREMGHRETDIQGEIERLDKSIKAEHEECIKYVASETGLIRDRLGDHRSIILEDTAERKQGHEQFVKALEEFFSRLRQNLQEEAEVRRKQCAATFDEARQGYQELNDAQSEADAAARASLDDFRKRLSIEKIDSANSCEMVTKELVRFIQHFERSIDDKHAKQQETFAYLQALQDAVAV